MYEGYVRTPGEPAVVRPAPGPVSVTLALADGELDDAVATAMSAAAQRTVPDLVALSITLRERNLVRQADASQRAAAAGRSAADVAEFVQSLADHGLRTDTEAVFAQTQSRGVVDRHGEVPPKSAG
ncbi:hypothetical protein [Streptomyces sp. NPDC001307]|uniref:hypothetical protein n=1 Tax=Streptomyces sp. NPDC001307 TaxID=3364560 RepID=UPI00367AA2C4